MIRRILVPLDSSPYCESAIDFAAEIAKLYDADLVGLVVLDIKGIEQSIGPIPLGASYYAKQLEQSKIDSANNRIDNLLDNFRDKCEAHAVNYRIHERQGIPSKHIIEESHFFDLLVIGSQLQFNFDNPDNTESLNEILKHSITPVIAIPKDLEFPKYPKEKINCLICFDGSIPASKALQRFGQLTISKFANVKILMSDDNEDYAELQLKEAKAFLKSHKYQEVENIHTKKNIIEVVNNEYLDWANLIVVGAHSQKGIFGFFVGSLTKFLVNEPKTAVFIGY